MIKKQALFDAIQQIEMIADTSLMFCGLHRDDPGVDPVGLIEALVDNMRDIRAEIRKVNGGDE